VLPDRILSTWIVVDVSRALVHYLGGGWGFALFSLLGLALALLPLFDRSPERDIRRRPLAAVIGLAFFLGFIGLWLAGRSLRTVPPAPAIEHSTPAAAAAPAADSVTTGERP
jgi:quinol-cytochrome oxidoreductase complex cytochrome b subunit